MGAVLDALSAYTERHLARLDRLRRSVCLLDYTLGCMHVIEETALQVRNMHKTTSFWLVVRNSCFLSLAWHAFWDAVITRGGLYAATEHVILQ